MKKAGLFLSCGAILGCVFAPMAVNAEEKELSGNLSILGWYADEVAEG